ncbi:MAG TPA: alpha-L-fucosidase [Actinomadura sp.]|nr:alpha-L-fucosidase [Actinomadura sp.]
MRYPARAITTFLAVVAMLLATTAATTPARAELFHPRQAWLRDSTAGLFLHWGMRTAPGYTDCAAWEAAVTDGGWKAGYWVEEAQKLHAQYLVLAPFHSRLGYGRAWPSKIPGSCSTKRDFLGELITAAKAEGLHVVLYMTDDPQWHAEGLPAGRDWLDSAAYSAYKGKPVDLTKRPGFGEFSYDNFVETMRDYPDLAGYWIDNDNEYWEQTGLYERIRAERPDMTLSNNNEDTPIMDMVSHEQKVGMTPAYDYPAAVWTPMPRLTEGEWKLPTKGAWWYDGTDAEVDYPVTVGRIITNAGASVKSLMAETAMVNGRFPPRQKRFNDFLAGYLPQIWESVHGVEGGGYMYGGMQPGAWNDGAYGTITVSRTDRGRQYVHVTTKPASDRIRIRDNGSRALEVTDVRTGHRMAFDQRGGYLTISGITRWDTYDTVFRVRTAKVRQGFYPSRSVTATSTAAAPDRPPGALTDGNHLTWWDSAATLPVSVTLDLHGRRPVRFLALHQREWSPTYNRLTFGRPEDSARIKDYRISVSDDGRTWGDPVKTSVLESARGVRFIDVGAITTRYIRLEVDSTWAAASAPRFYRQLQIDEIQVGWGSPAGHGTAR